MHAVAGQLERVVRRLCSADAREVIPAKHRLAVCCEVRNRFGHRFFVGVDSVDPCRSGDAILSQLHDEDFGSWHGGCRNVGLEVGLDRCWSTVQWGHSIRLHAVTSWVNYLYQGPQAVGGRLGEGDGDARRPYSRCHREARDIDRPHSK